MARIETWTGCDLDKTVQVRQLCGYIFSQDNEGNLLGVRVTQDGEPVTLTGTVIGYAILADGQTVDITGDSTGVQNTNEAFIILPQLAYSVPGQISIVIKLTTSDTITTLAAFTGYVYRSKTGSEVVPPGTPVPDLSTLEEAINNANTAATAANTAAAAADNVDISMTQVGDEITITTTDSTGTQTTATLTDQSEDVNELKTAINSKAPVIIGTASGTIATFPDGADGMPIKSLAISLEPIQEGEGDPSPQNVRPITGHSGTVNVYRTGKNLLPPIETTTSQGVTFSQVGDYINIYSASTPTGNAGVSLYSGILPAGTYTINGMTGASNSSWRTGYKIGSGSWTYNSDTSRTITSDGKSTLQINLFAYPAYGAFNNVKVQYQLEIGTESTAFEPYVGHTYPITLPTSAGTVYGGTLDPVKGTLTVDRLIKPISELSWTFSATYNRVSSNTLQSIIKLPASNNVMLDGLLCSAYKADAAARTGGTTMLDCVIGVSSGGTIYIRDLAYSTADAFVAAMGSQTIVYPLATPTVIENLTPTEITTLLGYNAVWSDSGDVTVEYPADTKLYIDRGQSEDDMNANATIAKGQYFQIGTAVYLATDTILAGEQIIPGTNAIQTTTADALNALVAGQSMPWELIREDTFTNATEADHTISADANSQPFELTDALLLFETPKQSTDSEKGAYGQAKFYCGSSTNFVAESGAWTQAANASAHGMMASFEQTDGLARVTASKQNTSGTVTYLYTKYYAGLAQAVNQGIFLPSSTLYVTSVVITAVTGTGHYKLFGKRKR